VTLKLFPYRGRYVAGAVLLIALLALAAPVGAAITISSTGGDDSGLITTAIANAAGDDGIVILNPGTYYAHDIVVGNSVTITSAGGRTRRCSGSTTDRR
jgi:hypothetical protein